jgi:hypothetical protein
LFSVAYSLSKREFIPFHSTKFALRYVSGMDAMNRRLKLHSSENLISASES